MQTVTWTPTPVVTADSVQLDDLEITFHRTVRVPDNGQSSALPPSLGHFPLHQVKDYVFQLPASMALKGGLFLPMYQREAMWIQFTSLHKYAIKLYVGGINAVSGEPAIETPVTTLRRRNLRSHGKSLQDYVVTPGQMWLDGVATESRQVRQFVAMPMGSGYSIEAQVTGEELTGGLQFEITKLEYPSMEVHVRNSFGKTIKVLTDQQTTVEQFIQEVCKISGARPAEQRLLFAGNRLECHRLLIDYGVTTGSVIHLCSALSGGGGGYSSSSGRHTHSPSKENVSKEMNLGVGGLIKQGIVEHKTKPEAVSHPVVFNVQILNTEHYSHVTGKPAPETPVTASEYLRHGFPFFDMYEEPSNISGYFSNLRSIGQLQGTSDQFEAPQVIVDVRTGKPGENWPCSACTFDNGFTEHFCTVCGTARPQGLTSLIDGWTCDACTFISNRASHRCEVCNGPRTSGQDGYEMMDEDDGQSTPGAVTPASEEFADQTQVGFFNPNGPHMPFRTQQELVDELSKKTSIF